MSETRRRIRGLFRGRRCRLASVCVVAGVSLSACSPERPDHAPVSDDEARADVERTIIAYLEAIASRDSAWLRQTYAEDGGFVWIEDGAVRYRSTDDVLASLAAIPPGTTIRTDLSDLEIVLLRDQVAHAWSPFETRMGEGDSAFSFSGLMSLVLERVDESWLIVGGHTSAPRPRGGG